MGLSPFAAQIMPEPILRRYAEVRDSIRNADLLLFRRRGRIGRLIAAAGRSTYDHAAIAGWWKDRLMCVEMTFRGGRAQLLSNVVQRLPGVIDLFEANAEHRRFSRERALQAMIALTGTCYGWTNLLRAAMLHLPGTRLFTRPETDDRHDSTLQPFCSDAVARACRAGGVDPVPNLADRLTEPGDLARSTFFRCRFTLC